MLQQSVHAKFSLYLILKQEQNKEVGFLLGAVINALLTVPQGVMGICHRHLPGGTVNKALIM